MWCGALSDAKMHMIEFPSRTCQFCVVWARPPHLRARGRPPLAVTWPVRAVVPMGAVTANPCISIKGI